MHSESSRAGVNRQAMAYWMAIAWRLFKREFGRGELTIIGLSIVLAVSSVMALSSVTDSQRPTCVFFFDVVFWRQYEYRCY